MKIWAHENLEIQEFLKRVLNLDLWPNPMRWTQVSERGQMPQKYSLWTIRPNLVWFRTEVLHQILMKVTESYEEFRAYGPLYLVFGTKSPWFRTGFHLRFATGIYPNVKYKVKVVSSMKRSTKKAEQEMGLSRPVFLRIYSLYRLKKFEERTCTLADKENQSSCYKQL